MKVSLPLLGVALAALSACVPPEQAAVNRAGFMAKVFPNPADRQGIHLVFAVDRSFMVSYYPDQISEAEVLYRVSSLCARSGIGNQAVHGPKPTIRDIKDLGNGQKVIAHDFVAKCV